MISQSNSICYGVKFIVNSKEEMDFSRLSPFLDMKLQLALGRLKTMQRFEFTPAGFRWCHHKSKSLTKLNTLSFE